MPVPVSSLVSPRIETTLFKAILLGAMLVALLAGPAAVPAEGALPQVPAASTPVAADTSDQIDAQARRLFVRGMTRAYVEDYPAAIAFFEKALESAPDEAPILSALAEAHAAQDDFTSALFYARQARERAPDNPHYHRELARLQSEDGRTEDAITTYRSMLERFPDDRAARRSLAQALESSGRPREAVAAYETLVERLPGAAGDDPEIRQEMLQLYREIGDTAGVERTLKTLMDLRPTDPLYREMLAELYVREDRVDDAIALYERMLDDRPSDVDVVSQLSTLYRRADAPQRADSLLRRYTDADNASVDQLVGRAEALYKHAASDAGRGNSSGEGDLLETATRLLRAALERSPTNAEALAMLGEIRYDAGAYTEAGDLLHRALQQNPKAPERWTLAASAFLRADRAREAAEVADEGLLLFPGQYPLVRISAFAQLRLGRNEAALAQMQEALDLVPDDASAIQRSSLHAGLGTLHHRLGDEAAADRAFEQALDVSPQNPYVANNYAFVLADRGAQLDRALELARRAVDAAPGNADFLDTLGWVQFQRGDLQAAQETLTQAVNTGAAKASVYEHLGTVYEALGNDAEARRYWQQALDRDPDRDAVRQKLDALGQ